MIDKQELHQLINTCDNEIVLAEVKDLLKSEEIKDWWEDLTSEDKNLVMESEMQYEKGNFISHDKLVQQFEEWKKK
jgi:predicted HAD superfamily phosphohydrolase YqeG